MVRTVEFVYQGEDILLYFWDPHFTFSSSYWPPFPRFAYLLCAVGALFFPSDHCLWVKLLCLSCSHHIHLSVLLPLFLSTYCSSYAKPCYTNSYALLVTLYCYWLVLADYVPLFIGLALVTVVWDIVEIYEWFCLPVVQSKEWRVRDWARLRRLLPFKPIAYTLHLHTSSARRVNRTRGT